MPIIDDDIKKIERVLVQFTMFALKEYPSVANGYHITGYKQRLAKLQMNSLHRRRINVAITTMYDILNGHWNCPSVRADIEFRSNDRNLRRIEYVRITDRKLRITPAAPLTQMCRLANSVSDNFKNATSRSNFIATIRKIPDQTFEIPILV